MRKFVLAAVLVLVAGGAQAASYLQNDSAIVDPIQTTSGTDHSYSGANLHVSASLHSADLNNANLHFANLYNAGLSNANLSGATLTNAQLTSANLSSATLNNADLTSANLRNATLTDVTLTNANLTSANLLGAILTNANLSFATLNGANLSSAFLFGADFSNAILANAIGLDSTFGDFATLYNANTDFTGTFFDPVAAGWTLVAIPEPNTALLLGFGLVGLGIKTRRRRQVVLH